MSNLSIQQSKILGVITSAIFSVPNLTLHNDLNVSFVPDISTDFQYVSYSTNSNIVSVPYTSTNVFSS